jgi:hypothetical protein
VKRSQFESTAVALVKPDIVSKNVAKASHLRCVRKQRFALRAWRSHVHAKRGIYFHAYRTAQFTQRFITPIMTADQVEPRQSRKLQNKSVSKGA